MTTQTPLNTRVMIHPGVRRPRSTYKKVVQGKCPLHFINLNGAVCSNTLFSNTSALTSCLLFRGNSTCKILEHLVWSNTSGFQFWGPLARTNFLSALCGLPTGKGEHPLKSTDTGGIARQTQASYLSNESKSRLQRGFPEHTVLRNSGGPKGAHLKGGHLKMGFGSEKFALDMSIFTALSKPIPQNKRRVSGPKKTA